MDGLRPALVYMDEAAQMLPPYDRFIGLVTGDQIVIVEGEQRGWRGTVSRVEARTVWCKLRRPDSSTWTNSIAQRTECVAKVLAAVPEFTDPDAAEEWLDSQLPVPVQEYASGARVFFSCPPHLAQRIVADLNTRRDRREWMRRHEDFEVEGKVIRYLPSMLAQNSRESFPGYEVLVMLDGEPELVEVAARRVKRLA